MAVCTESLNNQLQLATESERIDMRRPRRADRNRIWGNHFRREDVTYHLAVGKQLIWGSIKSKQREGLNFASPAYVANFVPQMMHIKTKLTIYIIIN